MNTLGQIAKSMLKRSPWLNMAYRLARENLNTLGTPRNTPLGFKFFGNAMMEQGIFEPQEVRIARKCLPYTDIFVNIGANSGYYCCIALQMNKPAIAFEPIDTNLQVLYKNIHANGWDTEIEVFPLALGNRSGLIEIFGGGTSASLIKGWAGTMEEHKRLVPISSLDRVLGDRLVGKHCFFVVDIEGVEKQMLEGARKHLAMIPHPIWMVEITVSEHQPRGIKLNPDLRETFQIFWDYGYEARTADGQFRLVTADMVEQVATSGVDSLLAHDFLFLDQNAWAQIFSSEIGIRQGGI